MTQGFNQYTKLVSNRSSVQTGIIKHLNTEPPDPANFNFVWTSTATIARSTWAKESSPKTTGFGVGVSSIEAKTKAIGEALELYAASRCSENELLYSSPAALSEAFLDPRQLGLYNRAQYKETDFPFERFHTRSRIAWTRGQWLDTGAAVWLPAFLTYFGARVSMEQSFAQVTTCGLATGTSVEDASIRAICELVERDAFMITWLGQVPARRLLADSALDQQTRAIVSEFEIQGLEMRFYLLSVGIDIPVVLCLILGDGNSWPGATVGLGAHASLVTATRKAILEQALMGPALRRAMFAGKPRIPTRANQIRTTLDHALYYVPKRRALAFDFLESRKLGPVFLSKLERPETVSLDFHVRRLRDAGVRVAVKDLTPPDVAKSPFRIVRALGTMLQPMHFGFGRSRACCPRLKLMAKNGLNPRPHPLA